MRGLFSAAIRNWGWRKTVEAEKSDNRVFGIRAQHPLILSKFNCFACFCSKWDRYAMVGVYFR